MSQQPETTSPPLTASPAPASAAVIEPASGFALAPVPPLAILRSAFPAGWNAAELYLRVLLRMYIGLAMCYAPWSHLFWDQNPLFLQFPTLGDLCRQRRGARNHFGLGTC